jgi:hypothetical protein
LLSRTYWGITLLKKAEAAKQAERRRALAEAAEKQAQLEQKLLAERQNRMRRSNKMKGRGKAIEPIVAPSKKYKNSPPPTS